ncbi:MAG: hypothetical protein MHM6MM_009084, partial [Cercozoa sp. M6MM]
MDVLTHLKLLLTQQLSDPRSLARVLGFLESPAGNEWLCKIREEHPDVPANVLAPALVGVLANSALQLNGTGNENHVDLSMLSTCRFFGISERRSCGYCHSTATDNDTDEENVGVQSQPRRACADLLSEHMHVNDYEHLLVSGWRRCGTLFYRPINPGACCPQLTLRLESESFRFTKSQRQKKNRFLRRLSAVLPGVSSVELTLSEAKSSDEKYALFRKYQQEIHNDESTTKGFARFLCDSPLFCHTNVELDGDQSAAQQDECLTKLPAELRLEIKRIARTLAESPRMFSSWLPP